MDPLNTALAAVPTLLDIIAQLVEAARLKNDEAAIAALEKFAREGAPALTAALDGAKKARAESQAKIAAAAAAETMGEPVIHIAPGLGVAPADVAAGIAHALDDTDGGAG